MHLYDDHPALIFSDMLFIISISDFKYFFILRNFYGIHSFPLLWFLSSETSINGRWIFFDYLQ